MLFIGRRTGSLPARNAARSSHVAIVVVMGGILLWSGPGMVLMSEEGWDPFQSMARVCGGFTLLFLIPIIWAQVRHPTMAPARKVNRGGGSRVRMNHRRVLAILARDHEEIVWENRRVGVKEDDDFRWIYAYELEDGVTLLWEPESGYYRDQGLQKKFERRSRAQTRRMEEE